MTDNSTTPLANSIVSLVTSTLISASTITTTTPSPISQNDTTFNLIRLLTGRDLYGHQIAELIEPAKYSVGGVHAVMWIMTIATYIIAIPIIVRMARTKSYLNVVDYFSFHLIICAFVAWIPALILLLYQRFQTFSLRLCRLHYVLLSTNETVPFFFVLYMIIERFLYIYPSLKQKCTNFSRMYCIHLYALFTWLFIMLIYAFASPFTPINNNNNNSTISAYTKNYCPYNYSKLEIIATVRSIIYLCLSIPALILIGFVLRYFYILRGTNQIQPIQKLWIIRVTSLVGALLFYDVYLYYLEHITETFRSFLLASVLRSTFYTVQICIIVSTEPYWIEFLLERCSCLCCFITGRRRKATTPVAVPVETDMDTFPYSSSSVHYSLVDDNVADEFDHAASGPEPTLRVNV